MPGRDHRALDASYAAVAVLRCDPYGVIVAAENRNLFISDADPTGHQFSGLFATESADEAAGVLEALQRGRAIITRRLSMRCMYGQVRDVYISGLPQIDHSVIILSALPATLFELISGLIRVDRSASGVQTLSNPPDRGDGSVDEQIFDEISRLNNELANARRTLTLRNRSLEALNAEKERMLGVVAHDLRNPLSVVTVCAEIILKNKDRISGEDAIRLIENILSSGSFMSSMVEDLLYFSKNSLGKLDIKLESVDLRKFIQDTIELNQIISSSSQNPIALEMPEYLGVSRVDPGKLRQVFNNLIGNAMRFSPDGSVIRVLATTAAGRLSVRVEDEGPGIPSAEKGKLLEVFSTKAAPEAAYRKGAGLGLSICKSIVEAHGGTIGFDSTEGAGSAFFFDLPYR